MKKIYIFLLCIFLCGCITMENEEASLNVEEKDEGGMVRNFVSTRQAKEGMSKSEVQAVLGSQVLVGYELKDKKVGIYKPIVAGNPHKTEDIQKGSKTFHVEYYVVGINVQDDKVSDDEIVPFVFVEDKLIGKGWDFLNKKVRN